MGRESLESTITKTTTLPDNLLDPNLLTGFTSIDRMVENLMKECENLQRQLQEISVFPDASAVQEYEAQNPEGASFWKDRFQKGQFYASALRYEVISLQALPTLCFYSSMLHITLTCRFLDRRFMFLGRALYMRLRRPSFSK